jgi:Tfp pilus assembly protein PilV
MVTRGGFSLAEVIVGMTLLCVAGLGVAATGLVAIQSFTRAEQQERLLHESEALLDSLLALPHNSAGTRLHPYGQIAWSAADSNAHIVLQVVPARGAPYELVSGR